MKGNILLRKRTLSQSDNIIPERNKNTQPKFNQTPKQTKHMPIIILTFLTDEKSKRKGLKIGAVDYVPKPFSPKKRVRRVKEILEYGIRKRIEKLILTKM